MKKSLTALAIAGALVFSGAAATSAAAYTPSTDYGASTSIIVPGSPVTFTFSDLAAFEGLTLSFFLTGEGASGATLASMVFTSTTSAGVDKVVSGGSVAVTVTVATEGSYTLTGYDSEGNAVASASFATSSSTSTSTSSSTSGSTTDGSDSLPATGGEASLAVVWLGAGALGLGGIAVAAGVARRRSASQV
ncbi:LPXTG cell wall anchor domain-containing protein [Microbacterium sp. NPDC076911]|uniref:LPXTG cell wall anchor domain-containing protein n=1 Tax=Microbacterium sp. NPDC076911 TaxID=3154958 RepID=UPI00343C5246